MKTLESIL